MTTTNWRTINIDLLDPESLANFDLAALVPAPAPVSAAQIQSLASQIKQLLRGGDAEGALRGALENVPYGGDGGCKVRACLFSVHSPCSYPVVGWSWGGGGETKRRAREKEGWSAHFQNHCPWVGAGAR